MRDTVREAVGRLREERGDTRPGPEVGCIERLGGGYLFVPVADVELGEVDDQGRRLVGVTSEAWIASDAVVDIEGVR